MLRKILRKLCHQTIENELTSSDLRAEYTRNFDISIGLYSYGCFDGERIGRKTRIGRYCSFAPTSYVYTRNHGIGFLGTTPYLYNNRLGLVPHDTIEHVPVVFEDDIWVGHGAVVLPSAGRIGRGAVLGACAVVTRPVEPYTIVGGNPARPLRKRFSDATIAAIEATRWWEWDLDTFRRKLAESPQIFFQPSTLPGANKA